MNNLFTSSFKKKGLKIFFFCASYLLCFLGISYVLINNSSNNQTWLETIQPKYTFNRNLSEKTFSTISNYKKFDIVFLGSSHCYRSFDPAFFEKNKITAYNLGSSSQTPLNSYFLLKKYIDYSNTFILEVYPITIALSGYEAYVNQYVGSNDYWFLTQSSFALNDAQAIQALLFKPFINHYLKDSYLNDSCFYKGYAYTSDSIKNKNVNYDTITLNEEKIEIQFKYLEKIAQLCAEKNKKLLLVYAPIPKEIVFKNEEFYTIKMKSFCTEHHLTFLNYGKNHWLNSKTNFFDGDHLNAGGVSIFNEMLLIDLKKQKLFTSP